MAYVMAANVSGVKTLAIRQTEESGTLDRFGVDVVTLVEEIPKADFPSNLRSKYSEHPDFPTIAVSKINWTKQKHGQTYRVTYIYEGFLVSLPEASYSLSSSLSEEPIELHSKFQDFAGTPAVPLNGAIFVDPDTQKITTDNGRGVFREFFATIAGVKNLKAGVEAYLSPGATWNEISFASSRPSDLGSLGNIDEPNGSEPSLGADRTWIYSGADYTRRGNIYEIRKTWLLSSKGGWDTDIYQA